VSSSPAWVTYGARSVPPRTWARAPTARRSANDRQRSSYSRPQVEPWARYAVRSSEAAPSRAASARRSGEMGMSVWPWWARTTRGVCTDLAPCVGTADQPASVGRRALASSSRKVRPGREREVRRGGLGRGRRRVEAGGPAHRARRRRGTKAQGPAARRRVVRGRGSARRPRGGRADQRPSAPAARRRAAPVRTSGRSEAGGSRACRTAHAADVGGRQVTRRLTELAAQPAVPWEPAPVSASPEGRGGRRRSR
jgi:hypothetical protein